MASLTVRNIDEELKALLRVRAAEHGRSMEEEVSAILREALDPQHSQNLADIAREFFGPKHGIILGPHPPVTPREPPDFS